MIVSVLVVSLFINPQLSLGKQWSNDKICGLSYTNRIIGGKLSTDGKYPWLARLGYKTNIKGRYIFLCGGTLINQRFVITAAHCLEYKDKALEIVRLGETTINCATARCKDPKVQEVLVKKYYKNNKFSSKTGFADIALVELGHPVQYTEWIRPICLIHRELAKEGQNGITAGFGIENNITKERPDGLKELVMKIIPGPRCKQRFPNSDFKSKNFICSGGMKGEDTCNGDSGGPFMQVFNLENGPRMYLIGVTSFGSTKCGSGVPGIFTSVNFHWDWVMDHV